MNFANRTYNRYIIPASFLATVYGGITLYKETKYTTCPSKDDMTGKVVVITGANSGIGFETCKELARRNATVVMACRHMGRCKQAKLKITNKVANAKLVPKFIDLANLDSIEEFAENVRNEFPTIDVLINNAGVMKPRPPKTTKTTDDGFEKQFGVNHLGHFLLTNLLLDNLMTSSDARVINVTSQAHEMGKIDLEDLSRDKMEDDSDDGDVKGNELYYQSKLSNVAFTRGFNLVAGNNAHNMVESEKAVACNCVNPGVVSTNIGRYASVPFYAIGQIFMEPIKFILLLTARQGAQTSIYMATDEKLKGISDQYFQDCKVEKKVAEIVDDETSLNLWEYSSKVTSLQERLDRIRNKEANTSTEVETV